jgi:hypothetical protein
MPKVTVLERFKDNLVFCSYCKKYLPRESFFDWSLRKNEYCCKECRRKVQNEWHRKHGKKSKEEIRKEIEQREEKELLENPFEQINRTVKKLTQNLGEYQEKEDNHICGYCNEQRYVNANGKNLCEKHFLIVECLLGCKPLGYFSTIKKGECQRRVRILERLEELGVEI